MLHHFYEALNAKVGIALHPPQGVDHAVSALHRARKKAGYPEAIADLKVIRVGEEVWIVQKQFFKGNKIDDEKVREALDCEAADALPRGRAVP